MARKPRKIASEVKQEILRRIKEEETKLSVKSKAGVKMELVIYYTGPEVKK